ncbi:MAG: hypothetical protein VKJ05_00780 [Synechococcaceae cyanobacterium]|nr:hypothetical protein [Synechococcaceae cyanobacterium]
MPVFSAPPTSPSAVPAVRAASAPPPCPAPWTVEPLQGWHLPLLDDPAFLPLQPLLQRALLLAVPDRLITAVAAHRPLVPHVQVAWCRDGRGRQHALGLIVSRRLNRSGSCWQVEHLCLALRSPAQSAGPSRQEVCAALLREALQRGRGAASWIAVAASVDDERLAPLREQGFQPQRTDRLWSWSPPANAPLPALPAALQLWPLNRRSAALLWHLEQACCPAPLRQLLDRRIDDLLDQSNGRGWMLVDPSRREAVAGARLLADHPGGGSLVELSVHPGWCHLLGAASERLLREVGRGTAPLWLVSEVGDADRHAWLAGLGAELHGEQVLMARSVWRRQAWQPRQGLARRRLAAVLEQLQPRRQPVPSPFSRHPLPAQRPLIVR